MRAADDNKTTIKKTYYKITSKVNVVSKCEGLINLLITLIP